MVRLPKNEKQTYRLNSRPQMWPSAFTLVMTLTLIFQGQICNFLYLSPEWSDYHKTKSNNVSTNKDQITMKRKTNISNEIQASNVTNGLDLAMTLIFEYPRPNVTLTFDHTHGVDQGFSWSDFEIALSQNGRADWHWTKGVGVGHSWPWLWPFGDQGQVKGSTTQWPGDFRCRRAIDSSSFIQEVMCVQITAIATNHNLWYAGRNYRFQ